MIKKSVFILASLMTIFTMGSCSFFAEKPQAVDLLKELDLETIDNYPEFDSCVDTIDKKKCFYNALTETIQQELDGITLEEPLTKEVVLFVKININGAFSIEKIENKNMLNKELILLLKDKISNLAKIKPALKQAIPTNSVYKVKVILQ